MKYVTAPEERFVEDASEIIGSVLEEGKAVTLFVSGGSAVASEAAILKRLSVHDISKLTVLPVDERYGRTGHADSNIAQLKEKVGWTKPNFPIVDMLEAGKSITATASHYEKLIKQVFARGDVTFGILGIGADGHTAGVLPGSKADTSMNYVENFAEQKFERVTMTKYALCKINHVYIYAYGGSKQSVIKELLTEKSTKPMKMFYDFPDVVVYTDNET